VVFEPVQRPVVADPDRVQHRPPRRVARQQGEHSQGLLGREREVIAHPDRRRPPPLEVRGKLVATHEPPSSRTTLGDQMRLARSTSLGERRVDPGLVGFVALGEPAQVLGGHTGQPGSFGDR